MTCFFKVSIGIPLFVIAAFFIMKGVQKTEPAIFRKRNEKEKGKQIL